MKKIKVGLLTFSDGRDYVHNTLVAMNKEFQDRIQKRLENSGPYEVISGREIIWKPHLAKQEATRLAQEGAEVTIFNFAVWSFPHLPAIASEFAPKPILLFSNINPKYPGLVGMLASAGALDQIGIIHGRVSGEIEDERVFKKVDSFLRAAAAVNRLKGETYGLFGGRPMGMYTAVSNLDQWKREFGVDVEHIDQMEIVRRSGLIDKKKIDNAHKWLEAHVGKIRYDGKQLTPEKLKLQIASYYAVREMMAERNIDFLGVKAQPELTENFATMDVTEAFLNDPYDWDGPHEPIVCATEADMDGALTMEIFKHLSGETVLFADVRHYDAEDEFFDLCNSGSHPTFFAGRSIDYKENLKNVEFWPEGFYFPAGGASVRHIAQPGEVTLARLTRRKGKYWMAIVPAEFLYFSPEKNEAKAAATQDNWPHAFARFRVPAAEFLATYDSNHIHGIYGNWVEELKTVCKILGIEYVVYE